LENVFYHSPFPPQPESSMHKPLHKVALIGAGRIGRIHARNAALHPRLELTAVIDPVTAPAQELAAQWNARVATLDEVLTDPAISGVIIASSTDTHLDYSVRAVRVKGKLACSDGSTLHAWTLAGCGLSWRSLWEVHDDIAAGKLVTVLDDYAAPPNGIFAMTAQRQHLPLRVRCFIDFLKERYAAFPQWSAAPSIAPLIMKESHA